MDETIVFDQPSSNFNCDDIYAGEHLAIPPLDYAMLTDDDLSFPENLTFGQGSDADLDFTIEDLEFIDDLLSDPGQGSQSGSPVHDSSPSQQQPVEHSDKSTVSVSPEAMGFKPGPVDQSLNADGASNLEITVASEPPRVSAAEHAKRESESSGHVSSQGSGNGERDVSKASNNRASGSYFRRKSDYQSPELGSCDQLSSHGSGEFNSGVSPVENPPSPDSCQSSPHFSSSFHVSTLKTENFASNRLADSRIKIEEVGSKFTPKRKKEEQDEVSDETRTNKFRRSSEAMENASVRSEEDDKKKSRLMRNRESAQLSRQRKKQYVEELEDKVKSMHSTITDLNSKISYIMAENATLRQQMSGGGVSVCPPLPPGMYPMAPMGYPWMPCPPYLVKAQGSQVPLVPIPRLKPQQPASAPKISKKADKLGNKKDVGKTKKVASISFLGLLFFMLLFGGLVPIIHDKYGGKLSDHDKFKLQNGRILMVDDHSNKTIHDGGNAYLDPRRNHESGLFKGKHCGTSVGQKEHRSQIGTGVNGSVPVGNSSEPLAASLYVPRNDKLVKIDGNLIIHSVLASEKAVSSHGTVQMKTSEETRLAIARNHAPSYHVTGGGQSNTRGPQLDDGRLQEWFSEDLSGSLLRSGMCTEVFQFDVSPTPGSIIPATPMTNTTSNERKNSGNPNKARNRRFLSGYPIPFDLHPLNVTKEQFGQNTEKGKLRGDNNSSSSMVVSVLVDPREAAEIDGEGVMRSKSLSRIFVVVLIDSVKYVTYSCMLPFMGGGGNKLSAE